MTAKVPLFDLHAQHASIRAELDDAIRRVLDGGRFVGGSEVESFEQAFATYCGARHCIGVSSGTDALTLALQAAGLGAGEEVLTTPLTFMATAESIVLAGCEPVFVDPDPDTALLSADSVEAAIGERTAAIVVVHLYGQPVDLDAFRELADRRGLLLIEDAAQAHGARWRDRRAGSVGDVAAFSFFPGKNLGALGDAGAVTTADEQIASRVAMLRDHGRSGKHDHELIGTNARLDSLQAAILRIKLAHLEDWNEARRAHAHAYDELLANLEGASPIAVAPEATSSRHQYVVRVPRRYDALRTLAERGVGAGVHYPVPLHRQAALRSRLGSPSLPNADQLADHVLSLPIFPELTPAQRSQVLAALEEHLSRVGEGADHQPVGSTTT